jgi:hypothetical protein
MGSLKGQIKGDHAPLNKFKLLVVGLPEITCVTVSEIPEELNVVDMPDRTVRSGGQTAPVELEIAVPAHHLVEIAALEFWYRQGQDPIDPGYKKVATLIIYTGTGIPLTHELLNVFIAGRTIPALDMLNEGEMAMKTYTLRADRVTPI